MERELTSSRSAAINQILGVIRQSQGLHQKSFEYFEKALRLDAERKGEASWRVQAIRIRIAEHYARLAPEHEDPPGQYEQAR